MSRSSLQPQFLLRLRERLPQAAAEFLLQRRWFGGKARQIRAVSVQDIVPLENENVRVVLALIDVAYGDGAGETYSLPLVVAESGTPVQSGQPFLSIPFERGREAVALQDALSYPPFLTYLLDSIANGKSFAGQNGIMRAVACHALPELLQPSQEALPPSLMRAEQSNSSVVYGRKLVLKLFRRVEEGVNPDLEVGRLLTERVSFPNTPAVAGYLEYLDHDNHSRSLGILQAFVENHGDAWKFTLDALAEYYGKALLQEDEVHVPCGRLLALAEVAIPDQAVRQIGNYLGSARLLARRTAELHLALNSVKDDLDFTPEPFRLSDQEKLADSSLALLSRTFGLLRQKLGTLPASAQSLAQVVVSAENRIQRYFRSIQEMKLSGMRSRIHGDYHLGQVLVTGDDFMLIDFEGEPARPLSERRAKRSPLQDVAGMLRSFHYAAYAPLLAQAADATKLESLGPWARSWQRWVSAAFLQSYMETSGPAPYIPGTRSETEVLLDAFMLDKAIYELGYELNNRPAWTAIPLEGISDLLEWHR